MQDPDPFTSYKELIRKGWFTNKHEELEEVLEALVAKGNLTEEERARLIQYSRNKALEDTSHLGRIRQSE